MNTLPREFDYFEFETKIRELISSLIGPVIQKSTEHEELLNKLGSSAVNNTETLTKLENTFNRTIVRMLPTDEFNKKILEITSDTKSSETLSIIKVESLGTRLDRINHQFSDVLSRLRLLEETQKNFKINFDEQINSIKEFKQNITEKVSEMEVSVSNSSEKNTNSLENISELIQRNSSMISEISQKVLPQVYVELEKHKVQFNEVKSNIKELKDVRVLPGDLQKLRNKLDHDIKKSHKESFKEIHSLKEYLDKMLRLEISLGVSDTLFQILDTRQIKKLIPVVENQIIDQSPIEKVQEIQETDEVVESVTTQLLRTKTLNQNKAIEQKIIQAKEKIMQEEKHGFKARMSTFKRPETEEKPTNKIKKLEQPEENLPIVPKPLQIIEEAKQVFPTKSRTLEKPDDQIKPPQIPDPEENKDMKTQNPELNPRESPISTLKTEKSQSSISFDPMLFEEQVHELSVEINLLHVSQRDSKQQMKAFTNAITEKISEYQKEFLTQVSMLHEEIKQISKQRMKDLTDMNSNIEFKVKEIYEKITDIDSFDMKISEIYKSLQACIESEKIVTALLAKDEEDRQGLQLTGYTESKPKSKNFLKPRLSVSLKPECLSCTGQNPLVFSAFKMACLNYFPSEIKYRQKLYSRKLLIEKLGEVLNNPAGTSANSPLLEKPKAIVINDDSSSGVKSINTISHIRVRNTSRHILDVSSSKFNFDPDTPLHSKREIKAFHR
jgi:hypothetical protein